jgi:hypothetical protein
MALGIGTIVVDYAPKARAEELGHHHHHESDYRLLKQPGPDSSCCSDQDCAPVKAELRQGQWLAFRQSNPMRKSFENAPRLLEAVTLLFAWGGRLLPSA